MPDDAEEIVARTAADPGELPGVVFGLRIAEERLQHGPAADDAERRAVPRRRIEEVHGRDQAAGARHVAHDNGGIAGKVLAEIAREQPRSRIVGAAGREADQNRDLLALVEVVGVRPANGKPRRNSKGEMRAGIVARYRSTYLRRFLRAALWRGPLTDIVGPSGISAIRRPKPLDRLAHVKMALDIPALRRDGVDHRHAKVLFKHLDDIEGAPGRARACRSPRRARCARNSRLMKR